MKGTIKFFAELPDKCGLEVFIVTKTAPKIKMMDF